MYDRFLSCHDFRFFDSHFRGLGKYNTMMERQITIGISSILELISCGADYGFEDDVLYDAFAEIIETLSDEEIESYALFVMNSDGYNIEDYDQIKERLMDFRKTYMK